MAALDPTAPAQTDEDNQVLRATLKLIRVPMDFDDSDEEDDEDYDPEDIEAIAARLREAGALPEEELESSEEDDSEDEKNGGPSDPVKSKKAMQQELADEMDIDSSLTNGVNGKSKGKAKITDDDISDEDDEDDEDDDEDDDEPEEFVLCTLNPENVRLTLKTLQSTI
jgi:FK506-binding nuclear protein